MVMQVLLLLLFLQFQLFEEEIKKAHQPKPSRLVLSRHGGKVKSKIKKLKAKIKKQKEKNKQKAKAKSKSKMQISKSKLKS